MESLSKYSGLVLIGLLLLSMAGCLYQSTLSPLSTATSNDVKTTIPFIPTISIEETLKATQPATPVPDLSQDPIFGVGMDHFNGAWGSNQMAAANNSWVRLLGVLWSSVEPTQGTYNWSVLAELEVELKDASSKGMQVILLVKSTPEWARKVDGTGPSCGPIAVDKLPAFGNFMRSMVARYSVAPYNVKYWEVWNEEDTSFMDP